MALFNQHNRKTNILATSIVGFFYSVVNLILNFIYRMIFLRILSVSYLGINGLFTNIFSILSLAELGITSAISFRLYTPISEENIEKVGKLMRFFRNIYGIIMIVILILGLMIFPFLHYFIKDMSEIPSDVNIYVIYVLYLVRTVSSYMYSYKQTLLSADQRQYILSLLQMIMNIIIYTSQITILIIYRNFTFSLVLGIFATIFMNIMCSRWVKHKYMPVFEVKKDLTLDERKEIYSETRATMLHKIGGVVLNGTDNLVLSTFVGVTAAGLYSNYNTITSGLNSILNQLLGNFTSNMGNAHVQLTPYEGYNLYRKLLFVNLWIAGTATTCLFLLMDDFICIWIGSGMLLDNLTVISICASFYIQMTRKITTSYTLGCGLFIKDRFRPIVTALINLAFSIMLVLKIGISGVFWGTVIAYISTVCWREPLILYKYEFKKNTSEYWRTYIKFLAITLSAILIGKFFNTKILNDNISLFLWGLKALFSISIYMILAIIANFKTEEFHYYSKLLLNVIERRRKQ